MKHYSATWNDQYGKKISMKVYASTKKSAENIIKSQFFTNNLNIKLCK